MTSTEWTVDGRRAGCWLAEVAYPWWNLTRNGWDVEFICPGGGRAAISGIDRSDPIQRAFLEDEAARSRLSATVPPDPDHAAGLAAVVFAGGIGALCDLHRSEELARFTSHATQAGAIMAACGHGTAGLLNATDDRGVPIIAGREVTTTSPAENRELYLVRPPFDLAQALTTAGATVSFGGPFRSHLVVDGPVITGQNPASAVGIAEAILTATAGPSSTDET